MAQFELPEPQPDPLLQLIGRYRADTRSNKIDLGVGVYKDNQNNTPVLAAVKEAEATLHQQQQSKSYLGLTGDIEFVEALGELILPATSITIMGAQTPGGSGALRLAAELYNTAHPNGTLWIGLPTWPNHLPLTESTGVKTATFNYFDRGTQQLQFEAMLNAVNSADAGDAILLHGCCHNPTGADLSLQQWQQLAELIAQRSVIPIIDIAYHGLGTGLDQDLAATRLIAASCEQTLIAASCSKNFGLYRDRTGAVYMAAHNAKTASRAQAMFGQIARKIYSMPPDHGAAVVRMILHNGSLKKLWLDELDTMVNRINSLRTEMAKQSSYLEFVAHQHGMFSLLPLTPAQVNSLIDDHAVYLACDGRINVAGCQPEQIGQFVSALNEVGYSGIE